MFDAKSLLDQFLGGAGGQTANRQGSGGQRGGGDDLMSRGRDFLTSQGGGLAVGSIAGLLLGSKSGRKIGKKAVTYGGMALVAGLAYKAYQNYKTGQGQDQGAAPAAGSPSQAPIPLEPPKGTGFHPEEVPGGANTMAVTLLSAMIAAAKADGHIDADEQRRIFDKIDEAGLDSEAKAFLMDELRSPLDLDKIVSSASTPEVAAEIYAVSRLAIDPDHAAEKAYLQMLAARLNLDAGLVDEIEIAVREAEEA